MSWLRWVPGRQGTGYRKMLLAKGGSWDCYVLDYPPGTGIPFHRDPVPGKEHHRVNVVLRGSTKAFESLRLVFSTLTVHRVPLAEVGFCRSWLGGRVVRFRPDLVPHAVRSTPGRRVVLSFGWVR